MNFQLSVSKCHLFGSIAEIFAYDRNSGVSCMQITSKGSTPCSAPRSRDRSEDGLE